MNDKILLQFLAQLSYVSRQLDDLKTGLKKKNAFKEITKNCDVTRLDDEALNEARFSFSIDSNLLAPIDDDLHNAGMSFCIFKKNSQWIFSGEVGWSSYNIGFNVVESVEKTYNDPNQMIENLQRDSHALSTHYSAMIERLG